MNFIEISTGAILLFGCTLNLIAMAGQKRSRAWHRYVASIVGILLGVLLIGAWVTYKQLSVVPFLPFMVFLAMLVAETRARSSGIERVHYSAKAAAISLFCAAMIATIIYCAKQFASLT